jgi:phage protein D
VSGTQPGPATRQSSSRRPRGIVRINGKNASFMNFRVEQKTHFSADTWHIEMECWAQPEGFGLQFFADSSYTEVEILIGFLTARQDVAAIPASGTSLIIGQVDDIDLDLNKGCLTLSGRDYTARLIDTKTANKYPNHVSSWIVTELAKEVGLEANVTATTTPAGEFYKGAYSSLSRDVPMWDLITFLAEQEGFDAYVTGRTIYFGPPQADADTNPFPVTVQRSANGSVWSSAKSISLKRSETVAKDISVTVLSHSQGTGKGLKAVATRAGTKVGGSSAGKAAQSTQSYVIRKPNLTQEQAQQLANGMLLDLTKFEKVADVVAEGDPTMTTRRRVRIAGTGTSFDRDYFVNTMTHACDHKSTGYEMTLSLKNHQTQSEESTV